MTKHARRFPEFYITAPQPCPYLPNRRERKLFTHLVPGKSSAIIDNLLTNGFRRSQNIAYIPYCENCSACVSVRIVVDQFELKRTNKRIWKRNHDLYVERVASVPTAEQYALFSDYVGTRHADGGMADMSALDYSMMVRDSVIDTFLSEYRQRPEDAEPDDDPNDWPLIAVALCDRLSDGLSLVYSFFDPELSWRSLGNFIILEHIEQARREGLPYVYLGYWIKDSPKMAYKTRFQPQEHLTPRGWVPYEPAEDDSD